MRKERNTCGVQLDFPERRRGSQAPFRCGFPETNTQRYSHILRHTSPSSIYVQICIRTYIYVYMCTLTYLHTYECVRRFGCFRVPG